MKHPLYNDPEYVAAIAETKECDRLMSELKNRDYRAWKIITEKESAYKRQQHFLTTLENQIQSLADSHQ